MAPTPALNGTHLPASLVKAGDPATRLSRHHREMTVRSSKHDVVCFICCSYFHNRPRCRSVLNQYVAVVFSDSNRAMRRRSRDDGNMPERPEHPPHHERPEHPAHPARPEHPEHPEHPEPHNHRPSHVGGRRRRRRNQRKGDGSQPSHAYDYLFEEIEDLREELVDTEDTFGFDSDEVHDMMAKLRLLEQIKRNAEMLDQGMPQEEFDDLVTHMTRLSELRRFEHANGPGSFRKRREREDQGHPDPDDPNSLGHDDQHNEEYESGKKERSQEMMKLNELIHEAEEHWRLIPKPMTHDASPEERKEIHELYDSLKSITNKEDRKVVREKLAHLQELIHDKRRHKDMDDEDKASIKALREEVLLAETEDEKREIREEIEDIYREHRQKMRDANPHGPPEHSRHRKNYHDTDEELQRLHGELHQEDDKEARKAIRAKIRDRFAFLRDNDSDTAGDTKNGGP